MKKILFLVLTTLLTLSCSDDDSGNLGGNHRTIEYEVTGNFTGNMSAAHTTESGGVTNTEIDALPLEMEFEFESSVSSAAFAIGGSSGIEGQTLTVKVYQDGELISTTPGTASSSGSIVVSTPPIVF